MISEIPGSQLSKHKSTAEVSVRGVLMWICRLGAARCTGLSEGRCTARTVCIAGRVALEITKSSSPLTEGNAVFSFTELLNVTF